MNGAAVTVGFAKARSLAETFVVEEPYACPPGVGAAAGVLVDGLSFRTAADADAPRVAGKETLAKGEGVAVLERRRDWYKVRVAGDVEGWVRWRSVDAASGAETICVELILSSGD